MSTRSTPAVRAVPFLAAIVALCAALPSQKGVPEPRVGVELKPPKGWIELPTGGDRCATLRLFAAPRATAGRSEGASQTPVLRVMFFAKGGDASKDVVEGLPRKTPFRSLQDFAERGLGTLKVKAQSAAQKAGAFDGQRVTATIGEGADSRTLIGQTIPLDDGECGVCFELFTNQVEKLKKEIDGTLDSLAAVARAGSPLAQRPQWITDPKSWAGMDPASRGATRKKWAEEVVAATSKAPELGFKVSKSKYWTVLSAAEPGFTKKAVAAAEAAHAWCAQKMPDLAKDSLPAVLRIFASPDHLVAFQATTTATREYCAARRELLCVEDPDKGGSGPAGFSMVCQAVLWQLFDDVDPGVLPALPRWFDNGCWGFMFGSKWDGKKLEFPPSDSERGRLENQIRANTLPASWQLIQEQISPSPADGANEKNWEYTPECGRLMRWIWLFDGEKAYDKPNFVTVYVKGCAQAFAANGPDPTADVAVVELEQAQQKLFNAAHYKWRDALLTKIYDLAIPIQKDAWTAIEEKWTAFNKNFK
jgi:hypothetical protein